MCRITHAPDLLSLKKKCIHDFSVNTSLPAMHSHNHTCMQKKQKLQKSVTLHHNLHAYLSSLSLCFLFFFIFYTTLRAYNVKGFRDGCKFIKSTQDRSPLSYEGSSQPNFPLISSQRTCNPSFGGAQARSSSPVRHGQG